MRYKLEKASLLGGVLLLWLLAGCGDGGEAAAGIVVDTTADIDGRDGVVSLREAILLATGEFAPTDLDPEEADNVRGSPGAASPDSITFDALVFPPSDPAIIFLGSTLPPLSAGSDTVDGSARGVVVEGGRLGFDCLQVASGGNTIRGLQILNCRTAVVVEMAADNNIIGGSGEGQGNVLSGNRNVGLEIRGSSNLVIGNYIGTDATGTVAMPNEMEGIWITSDAQNNVIGGSAAGERNVISGNGLFGLSISRPGATGNTVKGNYIGVDAGGKVALGNGYGVLIGEGAQDNTIGGSEPGEANIIAGNRSGGLIIRAGGTSGNTVQGNYIGTDSQGRDLGMGYGVWLHEGAQNNAIGGVGPGEGNVIANNAVAGVLVEGPGTTGNVIRGNSIHSNRTRAIGTQDGGNAELAPPSITESAPIAGTACPNCTVDIYSDAANQGEVYEGWTVADAEGHFTFTSNPSLPNVTAAAIDAAGNTSELAEPLRRPIR
jgi:CSLREA domain-containing protein